MRLFITTLSLFFTLTAKGQLPIGFNQTIVAENLDPTHMTISDDGRIFITEKRGIVRIFKDNAILADPLISIPVDNFGERGLEGIVLDPDFGNNQFFYLYYTVPGKNHNRVSRFKASGDYADIESELVLIDIDILSGSIHNGGAMLFGNDGKLYIATGDGFGYGVAQNFGSLLGKILRVNPDGSIPEDNPFYNINSGKYRAIYALGFRNPFSAALDPTTGKIFINDVGDYSYEEVNSLSAGKNYGWPHVEGIAKPEQWQPANYQNPLYAYPHSEGCAIVGASFYSPLVPTFPEKYKNKFFFGDYCSNFIRVLNPETGTLVEEFASNTPRPVGILTALDGTLYYFSRGGIGSANQEDNSASNNGTLWKVNYTGSGIPSIYKQPSSHLISTGESVTLTIGANGSAPLSYQWTENGLPIENSTNDTLIIENVTLDKSGAVFTATVTNNEGSTTSNEAHLSVTSNTRPQPTILSSDSEYKYKAGDTIRFKGSALDIEDGIITKESLTWQIDFHHNDHIHPALQSISGIDSSGFVFPIVGETSPNVWYRIYLSAIDSEGLNKTVYKDIYPLKSRVKLLTEPSGLTLNLDGQPITTPLEFEGVVGIVRSFYAPSVLKDETNLYTFNKWSGDLFTNMIQLNTPDIDSTFTAFYTTIPLADGSGLKAEFFNQDKTFNPPANYTRADSNIDFDWNIQSPQPGDVAENNFTALWTGYIMVPQEDNYTFHLLSDDGSRLWIDNQLIVDNWSSVSGIEKVGSFEMIPGKYYRIRIEYFDSSALATIKLYWSSSAIAKSIIPKNQFFLINPDNTAPSISITSPRDDYKFTADKVITLKADASDLEDGALASKTFRWRIELHHDDHVHPVFTEVTNVDSISFQPELEHSEVDVYYEAHVSVTDWDGVTTETSMQIQPLLVNMNFNSNISGVQIDLNGLDAQSSSAHPFLAGTTLPISTPKEVYVGSVKYEFSRWSDPSVSEGIFTVPSSDKTISAIYSVPPQLNIISPSKDFRFSANEKITVVASASDFEDGLIDAKKYIWKVELFDKNESQIVFVDYTNVSSVTFEAQVNPNSFENIWYRVSVSVTDKDEITVVKTQDILPSIINIGVASNIENIQFLWDNDTIASSSIFQRIEGTEHQLSTPKNVSAHNLNYEFDEWLNLGTTDTVLSVKIIESPAIFTALYKVVTGLQSHDRKVSVYPNPFTTKINIHWNKTIPENVSYELTDSLGKLILKIQHKNTESDSINLAHLGSGVYFLTIQSSDSVRRFKIVKM